MSTSIFSADSNPGDPIDPSGASRLPKDLRRQQLIGNAVRVFASQGYHTTTMDHIAAASNVTKPVLYQHFTGKRDLYLAVLDEQINNLMTQLVQPLHATKVNLPRHFRIRHSERLRGARTHRNHAHHHRQANRRGASAQRRHAL